MNYLGCETPTPNIKNNDVADSERGTGAWLSHYLAGSLELNAKAVRSPNGRRNALGLSSIFGHGVADPTAADALVLDRDVVVDKPPALDRLDRHVLMTRLLVASPMFSVASFSA